jgi:hypothetical protein
VAVLSKLFIEMRRCVSGAAFVAERKIHLFTSGRNWRLKMAAVLQLEIQIPVVYFSGRGSDLRQDKQWRYICGR